MKEYAIIFAVIFFPALASYLAIEQTNTPLECDSHLVDIMMSKEAVARASGEYI